MSAGVVGRIALVAAFATACSETVDGGNMPGDGGSPPGNGHDPTSACEISSDPSVFSARYSAATYAGGSLLLGIESRRLSIRGEVQAYTSVGLQFEDCLDVSAFSGIGFQFTGSLGPDQYAFVLLGTRDDTAFPEGSCEPSEADDRVEDCRSAWLKIASDGFYQLRWSEFDYGAPNPMVDPKQVVRLLFGFPPADEPYSVDVRIEDLAFF